METGWDKTSKYITGRYNLNFHRHIKTNILFCLDEVPTDQQMHRDRNLKGDCQRLWEGN